MSRAADAGAGDVEPTDEQRGEEWLERNATAIEPDKRKDTDSFERAQEVRLEADVDDLKTDDLFRVELPDGEGPHLCLMLRDSDGDMVGACSCHGYTYTDGHYCAHLFVLGMLDAVREFLRVQDMRAASLRSDGGDLDPEVIDHTDDVDEDDDQDESVDDQDELVECSNCGAERYTFEQCPECEQYAGQEDVDDTHDVERKGEAWDTVDDVESGEPGSIYPAQGVPVDGDDVSPVEPQGERSEDPVPGVDYSGMLVDPRIINPDQDPLEIAPEWAKETDEERDGDVALNKRGCQFIEAVLGIDVSREELVAAADTEHEYAKYEATARLGHRTATRTAKAHIDEDNVSKADMNRMAETRAYKRAVKSISGGGVLAFAKYLRIQQQRQG